MEKTPSRFIAALLVVSLIGAACSPPVTPTPTTATTLTPTSRLSTHEGTLVRATLPPTWTETPTPLPTATFTPTPVTPTATLTAVPSLDELCDTFSVSPGFADGRTFQWSDTITMLFGTTLTAVGDPGAGIPVPLTVRWLATERESGENLGLELAGGEIFAMELPISRLPRPGTYDWTVGVYGTGFDAQCIHEGTFTVSAPPPDAESTAEATVEATAETTAEATSEPTAVK